MVGQGGNLRCGESIGVREGGFSRPIRAETHSHKRLAVIGEYIGCQFTVKEVFVVVFFQKNFRIKKR